MKHAPWHKRIVYEKRGSEGQEGGYAPGPGASEEMWVGYRPLIEKATVADGEGGLYAPGPGAAESSFISVLPDNEYAGALPNPKEVSYSYLTGLNLF